MLKIGLLLGLIGHVLCGICDCLLSYSPKKRLDLKGILKDPTIMHEEFKDMPLKWPLISIMLGVFSITMFGFGYMELSKWMQTFSNTASIIMYVSTIVFLVSIVVHHVICGLVEWFYIKLGRTNDVRDCVLEFQIKTITTMFIGYFGLLVFLVTLFIMIVCGKTGLPVWACIFNTLILMVILSITKLPAKGNIAGAIMFFGLLVLIL